MPYILGASFSNVQHSFNLPTYFVAVAIESVRKSVLENIRTKEELQEDLEHKRNLFDLSRVENEINRFNDLVIKSRVIKLTKKDRKKAGDLLFMLDGFLRAIQSAKSSDLRVTFEGFERCFLHIPLNPEGKELIVEDLDYFHHPLSKYRIKFQRKGEFDKILELARLFVWFENLNMVRRKRPFMNKQIRRSLDFEFFQIHKLVWNTPPIESYPNSFVGYPRMVVKTQHDMKDILIHPNRYLDIFPISPACSGLQRGLNVPRCVRASSKEPFGTILSNGKFEKCKFCTEHMKGALCLFQKPRCDGKEMICGDRAFVSQVCHADFCIYVTLYNDKVKVGRSIKSRIIGRLIEQCAFDGLVFYPVPWLPFADYLEEKLVNLLRDNISSFKAMEVSRITEKITSEERFKNIMLLYNNSDVQQEERDMIYDRMIEILNSLGNPEATYLLSLEQRKVNLKENWKVPDEINLDHNNFVQEFRFKRIKGNVTGVMGSFVSVNDKAYDTTKMGGYIVGVPRK